MQNMVSNKKEVISFGTNTIAKRCGVILITASLLGVLVLCLYWNITNKSFFHAPYLVVEGGEDFPIKTTSIEQFDKFMSRNFFYLLLSAGGFFGLMLFSGFADALAKWIRTGSWPQKTISQENLFKAEAVLGFFKRKTTAMALITCFFVLALMLLEDWSNASAAYFETFLQVAAFALLLWIGKQCVKIIRRK